MDTLAHFVNTGLMVEKLRVASQVSIKHLQRQGREDAMRDELFTRIQDLESYIDDKVANMMKEHSAYRWFSQVPGIGKENISKVIGLVRIKEPDFWRCTNPECRAIVLRNGETQPPACPICKKGQTYLPPHADTISALWKFAGLDVDAEGHAPRRVEGQKLTYNSHLRSMCWRVGGSLLKAGIRNKCVTCGAIVGVEKQEEHEAVCHNDGKYQTVALSHFGRYYTEQKQAEAAKLATRGVKVVPATKLPKNAEGKRYEPPDMMSEGHVHNRAERKMIKLFLACLWLVWREAEGLPVRAPYAIEHLGHEHFITPWEMTGKIG